MVSVKQIHPNIDYLEKDNLREWISIAMYILDVDQNATWSKTHRSFTEWLVDLSSKLSLNESSLWRYYRAGKYYQKLLDKLHLAGVDAPSFPSLSKKVSPENLEILEKIERAVPNDFFFDIASRVIKCTIKRDKLRSIWTVYRKVLAGKTARGLGVSIPRMDHTNRIQVIKVKEAQVQTALNTKGKEWIGCETPNIYEVIPNFQIKSDIRHGGSIEADAVIIFQSDLTAPIQFVEIEIKSHNDLTTNYESMEKKQAYFDFQWIAFHKFDVKLGIGKIPKHIGVITLNEDGFSLIRSAERNELMGTRAIETAKVLLGKFVKR